MATEIASAYIKLIPTTKGMAETLSSELGAAGSEAGTEAGNAAGSSMKSVLSKIGIGAAITKAVSGLVSFTKESISVNQEFEASMSQVAATMGTTTDQISGLTELAKQYGETTKFTASEASEALNYMALAGYDEAKMAEMLPNVLNLAAAGNMDLARASDMITDSQSALGLSMGETTTLVDQMAKTASITNTSVEQLGDAILTVGGTANFMAGGTEEITAALGVLADNGIKASEGGTHLRNMLLKLASPTDEGAAALEKLGVSVFDAEGKMRSFSEIFPEMKAAMSDLTEEEQLNKLSAIFNTRDIAAAQALLNTTTDRWTELDAAITECSGAAGQMAETQLDNLQGDMTLFQSALEGAQIAMTDGMMPVLRDFVQFGTSGIGDITAAIGEGGLTAGLREVGPVLMDAVNMIAGYLPEVLTAVGALLEGLFEALPAGLVTMLETLLSPDMTSTILEVAMGLIEALASGVVAAVPILIEAVPAIIGGIVDGLLSALPELVESAVNIILALVQGIGDSLPLLAAMVPNIIITLIATLLDNLPEIITAGVQLLLGLLKGIIQTVPELIMYIPTIIHSIWETFTSFDWKGIGKNIINGVKNGVREAWENFKEWFFGLFDGIISGVKNLFGIHSPSTVFAGIGENLMLGLSGGVQGAAWAAQSAVRAAVDGTIAEAERINAAALSPWTIQTAGALPAAGSGTAAGGIESAGGVIVLQLVDGAYNLIAKGTARTLDGLNGRTVQLAGRGVTA